MYQVRSCFSGENRNHWAVTLYYQRNISWPALDGLMIDFCSIIFRSGQMPDNVTASVSRRKAWCTLSFSWLTVTFGTQVVWEGSEVNWFGEACLRGSDWDAEGPVSVLCKVQSCVTYWHTHVCFEYHWILCRVLKGEKKTGMCEKTFHHVSSFVLHLSWMTTVKRDAASTEVSSFLHLLILCDCSLFSYLVTESHRSRCIHDRLHLGSGYRRPCIVSC